MPREVIAWDGTPITRSSSHAVHLVSPPRYVCPRCGASFRYEIEARFHLQAECPERTLRERLRWTWQRVRG